MIPPLMSAIAVEGGKGPAEALKLETIPTPAPGPGQILIQVAAAGVNRPDVIQRLGFYPPPPGAPQPPLSQTAPYELASPLSGAG